MRLLINNTIFSIICQYIFGFYVKFFLHIVKKLGFGLGYDIIILRYL
ncbi:hypothetical protein HMPREF0072_1795 [Anaerococcus lactolyticus ATCC 51172]|uniref:Uncharacterized protein n=1 Tax=Anaerococcus lactolyticus ATCC 51172 TaxID=525254 RepID=C2BHH5_9FIRM|nr:hypothetical protein HMPREF0072_1795 [Anaerococcus lactolyticus ATCC 51172]